MKDFRKLMVWEKSHALAIEVYRATAGFPRGEVFGLTAQIRRGVRLDPVQSRGGLRPA
jgi:hypothetical protein